MLKNEAASRIERLAAIAERRRKRLVEWQTTVRCMALLVAEQSQAAYEHARMVGAPLGWVHGVLDRIRSQIGPDAAASLCLDSETLLIALRDPHAKRSRSFTFDDKDYDKSADQLAEDLAKSFEKHALETTHA